MVKKMVINWIKFTVVFIILVFLQISCVGLETTAQKEADEQAILSLKTEVLPAPTATPTAQILSSNTPDLTRPDTIREATFQEATRVAGQPSATPVPSPSPTLNAKQLCQPFPESMLYLGSTQILGFSAWTVRGRCQGEMTYFRSPVGDMALYDYSALTGRFVYGSPLSSDHGLWVYDYWTELSEKWSDDSVIQAEWTQVKNAQDIQQLGILNSNGILSIASGPFQTDIISDNVSSFSIEPNGKRLAFVKKQVLYVVGINGGQPRKLAEEVNGKPVWANAGTALIFPSSPIKIAQLDGSGSFIPQDLASVLSRVGYLCEGSQNCTFPTKKAVDRVLWNETRNLLIFYSSAPINELSYRHIYVYELSDDLRKIVNFQRNLGEFTDQIAWDIPGESLVDSAGNTIEIGLRPEFLVAQARINTMSKSELGIEFTSPDPLSTTYFGHHFTNVLVTDQLLVLDTDGNVISLDTITTGMTIKLTGRRLNPYTLSLFADTIQIYCDQIPCFLGFEGRS